jgi:UDP-N-acetylmuramate dehydrogenase
MKSDLTHQYRGVLTRNESLRMLNSWHCGGVADQTYRPVDLLDLSVFLQTLPPTEPITWLGLGSNVLVRDGGIRGTVILTLAALNSITPIDDNTIRVEAGVTCAKIAKYCAKHQWPEGDFFAGIPGTMGGALAMNAGAFGGETWNVVSKVEVINRQGLVTLHEKSDFDVAYREVPRAPDTWFVAGHLSFTQTADADTEQRIKALLARRNETQPIGLPSCGSVFRNPPNDHAARLIEACGLKGYAIGDAQVSPKHANFIINTGKSTSADMEALIFHVQATVHQKMGILLKPEVHFLGEF